MSRPASKLHDLSTPVGTGRKRAETWIVNRAIRDADFRQNLIANPQETISKELNLQFPANFSIQVVEETGDRLFIVLPPRSTVIAEELLDNELEMVVGGKSGGGGAPSRPPVLGGDDSHTQTLTSSGDIAVDH